MSGEAKNTNYIGPSARLVMAMALYRKGSTNEARTALAAAVDSYDWSPAKADNRDVWIPHILRREAEGRSSRTGAGLLLHKLGRFDRSSLRRKALTDKVEIRRDERWSRPTPPPWAGATKDHGRRLLRLWFSLEQLPPGHRGSQI